MSFEVLGVSGQAGSGKDYIASNVLRPLGYHSFSLAWSFKIMIVGTGEATYEEVFVTKPPHVRKLLQLRGTEEGRNVFGEDVWCNVAFTWMKVLNESWGIKKFVVPDVRFKNEVRFIRNNSGKVFRIEAPERIANSKLTPEQRQHISETDLDDFYEFDGYIANDYTSDTIFENSITERVVRALNPNGGVGDPQLFLFNGNTMTNWHGTGSIAIAASGDREFLRFE